MKKILLIALPILIVIGVVVGYFFYSREKVGINEVTPTTCPTGSHQVYNYNAAGNRIAPYCAADTTGTTNTEASVAPSTSSSCVTKPNCLIVNPPTCAGLQPPSGKTWCATTTTTTTTTTTNGDTTCSKRYYYSLDSKGCVATTRNYNSAEMDCDGGTGKTCVVNLQEALPGKTGGSCFKTEELCLASKAICSPRYYFNTVSKLCVATNRSYDSKDVDCDGQTNKTCAANLQDWEPGRTTGICYASQTACLDANKTTAQSTSTTTNTTASSKPSPSPSVSSGLGGGTTVTPTPSPSPRAAMPDTSEGTPVTGVFEVTAGTVGIGLLLLIAGIFGILMF